MNHFPMFYNIKGKRVLIYGSGAHALEKLERLQPFEADITVIAPEFSQEIRNFSGVKLEEREFCPTDPDLYPVFAVVAEEYERALPIVNAFRQKHIPVNTVDIPSLCDFFFPSMLVTERLCVAVSSSGCSPTAAMKLKRDISALVPQNIDAILEWMPTARERIKSCLPKGSVASALALTVEEAFALNRPLNDSELDEIIKNSLA